MKCEAYPSCPLQPGMCNLAGLCLEAQEGKPRSEPGMIDALAIRRKLGAKLWLPPKPYGDGWQYDSIDGMTRIIVSPWIETDDVVWLHASLSHYDVNVIPTYWALKVMHRAVFDGPAYQVFVPDDEHINQRNNVLHLWGRRDGEHALPNFGRFGTI